MIYDLFMHETNTHATRINLQSTLTIQNDKYNIFCMI